MHLRRMLVMAAAAAVAAPLGATASASAASAAGAEVFYPPRCGWTVGSFPGVDQEVLASSCRVVLTPSGGFHAVLRGQLPDGTALDRTYVERGRGCIIVATRSGRIVNVLARC